MKNLIKMISFILLCAVFINPMGAMEEGDSEVPAASINSSQTYVPYNAGSIDEVTDLSDMFNYLYDHDWICPICLEENLDDIVPLRECGHKFHRACIGRFLNTDTVATMLCPVCKEFNLMGAREILERSHLRQQNLDLIRIRLGLVSQILDIREQIERNRIVASFFAGFITGEVVFILTSFIIYKWLRRR